MPHSIRRHFASLLAVLLIALCAPAASLAAAHIHHGTRAHQSAPIASIGTVGVPTHAARAHATSPR